MPKAAWAGPRIVFTCSEMSTRAFARPMAGTTHSLQLHRIPCQANFPMLAPQEVLGQVKRPDNGASADGEPSGAPESPDSLSGKRLGRIQVNG